MRPPTPREAGYVAALELWLSGRPSAAAARVQQILDDHPRDALAMKLVHAIHFIMGRPQAMRRSVEAETQRLALSRYFSPELIGQLEKATALINNSSFVG